MKRSVIAACALTAMFADAALAHEGHDNGAAVDVEATVENIPAGEYRLDPAHGYVTFTYDHLGFSRPTLAFRKIDATLTLDPADPAKSRIEAVIDVSGIESLVPALNKELVGPDFFDAASHPTIVFKSTQALQSSAGTGKLFGDLTVKGVTKAVVLDVTLNQAGRNPITGKETIGVSAHGRVLRSDWGLDAYVPAVSDELEIRIEAEFEHQD